MTNSLVEGAHEDPLEEGAHVGVDGRSHVGRPVGCVRNNNRPSPAESKKELLLDDVRYKL